MMWSAVCQYLAQSTPTASGDSMCAASFLSDMIILISPISCTRVGPPVLEHHPGSWVWSTLLDG